MKLVLSYDDVLITPKFSMVTTRQEVKLDTVIGHHLFSSPLISANMDTVTGVEMAKKLGQLNVPTCLHRFCTVEENVQMFKDAQNPYAFCSVGISTKEYERFEMLWEAGCRNFIIDVAHAASYTTFAMYRNMVDKILSVGYESSIIVGNFATKIEVMEFLKHCSLHRVDFPAAIKIGVGGSGVCSTRVVTGAGWPTLQSLLDIKQLGIPMIACGGHKNSGDIAKALAAGAVAVMVGGVLAGHYETPGHVYQFGAAIVPFNPAGAHRYIGELEKKYRGSASKESYEVQGKVSSHRAPEGVSTWVDYKGPVEDTINEIHAGLKSSCSYVNAFNLTEFRYNAELVQITGAGYKESTPYGK